MPRKEWTHDVPSFPANKFIPSPSSGRVIEPFFKDGEWRFKRDAADRRLVPYDYFRTEPVDYLNSGILRIDNPWDNFDPESDFYLLQPGLYCKVAQQGYVAGDVVLYNGRRITVNPRVDRFDLAIGSTIIISRKIANWNEFGLVNTRWQVFLQGYRWRELAI